MRKKGVLPPKVISPGEKGDVRWEMTLLWLANAIVGAVKDP